VYKGYIGDPLADTSQLGIIKDDTFTIQTSTTKNTLALNIVALDPGWTNSRIRQAVSEASFAVASPVTTAITTRNSNHLPGNRYPDADKV